LTYLSVSAPAESFLAGGGNVGELMRRRDWTSSPLGSSETWPPSLRSVTALMLASKFPMFLAWGPELSLLYNDPYALVLGEKHPDALGCRFDRVWSEIWTEILPFVETALAGKATWVENLPLVMNRRGHDEMTYFTFSYSPVLDDEARVAGMFCVCTETTGQVLGELRKEGEQDRQRLMLRQMPGFACMLTSPNHRFEYVNDSYLDLVGSRDFDGRPAAEVLPELKGQGFFELLDEVYRSGIAFAGKAMPIRLDRADGERFVDLLLEPTRNEAGAVTGIFVGGYDVTDRIRAEQALRQSEEQFRFLDALGKATAPLTEANDILATTTRMVAEHLRLSNCAYADMDEDENGFTIRGDWAAPGSPSIVGHYHLSDFGRLAVQNLSAGLPLVVNDNLAELAPEEAATFQAIGIAATICMPLVKDGRLTALMAIHDKVPHAWTPGELALIREVTERSWAHIERAGAAAELKKSAEALIALNATLEQRVQERTGELMAVEEALRQSQKMEAVGQLTGGIAHDFNNLLAGISGSLEMMQTRIAQGRIGDIDRYMDGAQGAAKRAAALTHRLLAFSRRQTLDPRPTDLDHLVRGMEDLVRRTVGPQIALEAISEDGLWPTLVDPNQLENALLNLCINARDAMPDGGRIRIATGNRWLDEQAARELDVPVGHYVSMCVSDNGTGMSRDVAERAFDPFFTTKPLGLGTGLGLSMIYGFARQSGGQVRIESEVGSGTTVCVHLPRHHGAAVSDTGSQGAAQDLGGAGETILVIDDEPLVRMLIVDVLEDLGYTAIEAGDGPEGLKVIRSDVRIDLLITDVGLPNGMNGRQVADAAREIRPGLKVMFVTGYAETTVLNNGHLDPAMQAVTKPFDLNVLASRIKSMVGAGS
jgi:signal transduction histidine kinase/PAS domain-containing protein